MDFFFVHESFAFVSTYQCLAAFLWYNFHKFRESKFILSETLSVAVRFV